MQIMIESVFRFLTQKPIKWTLSGGMSLNGLIALFRATGDQDCRRAVLDYMESSVSPEGTILCASACLPTDLAACGKALFFALDETGDERYRKALDAAADGVKDKPLPTAPAELYAVAPFLAEYDTRFGGKQAYKAIADHFKAVHQAQFDWETGLYRTKEGSTSSLDEGWMRLALADTAEKLDMMIYEHYRTLADLFLDAVRTSYQKGTEWKALLSGEDTEKTLSGYALNVSAILKGIRLQLLDEEKYLPHALFANANLEAQYAAGLPCDPGAWLLAQSEARRVIK